MKGRILRSRRLPSASMLLFQLAAGAAALPKDPAATIALPMDPAATVAMPANSAIDDAPADAPAWDTAGDFAAAAVEEADSFQSVFYNEAGDIVNYDPNLQVASRACMHLAGPVHVNFPFDAPLKPDFAGADLQAMQRAAHDCFALGARNASIAAKDGARLDLGPLVGPAGTLPPSQHRGHRAIVVEAALFSACRRGLLRDRGGSRGDSRLGAQAVAARARRPAVGAAPHRRPAHHRQLRQPLRPRRLPRARGGHPLRPLSYLEERNRLARTRTRPVSLAVDVAETRDFNAATDVFVGTTPSGSCAADGAPRAARPSAASLTPGSPSTTRRACAFSLWNGTAWPPTIPRPRKAPTCARFSSWRRKARASFRRIP